MQTTYIYLKSSFIISMELESNFVQKQTMTAWGEASQQCIFL